MVFVWEVNSELAWESFKVVLMSQIVKLQRSFITSMVGYENSLLNIVNWNWCIAASIAFWLYFCVVFYRLRMELNMIYVSDFWGLYKLLKLQHS